MSAFTNLLPSIVAVLTVVFGVFTPQISGFVAAHPTLSVVIGAVYSILSHFLPSPVAAAPPVAK